MFIQLCFAYSTAAQGETLIERKYEFYNHNMMMIEVLQRAPTHLCPRAKRHFPVLSRLALNFSNALGIKLMAFTWKARILPATLNFVFKVLSLNFERTLSANVRS